MPPSRTGIADYSAALAPALSQLTSLDVISDAPTSFDPSAYDLALYQLGNNPWHAFVYDLAIEHPGVIVLHESNLHHLLTDVTIRRALWDNYLVECEYNGGPEALAYARRVRALEVGPDYDNLPMTRRLLERSRGVIVHSRFVAREVRRQGFTGPIAVIPHGAWIPDVDRMAARDRLGLAPHNPLIGIFGFLKPYKRIAESLRAFRRLVKFEPSVRMLLAGEVHPELPLESMIRGLGLEDSVRYTGHIAIDEFTQSIAASDIVLNLRYPTVGESSGTLLRALGLGRAVLVSDVGSFTELPSDVCLKVPVDAREEDTIFEFLQLLVTRPQLSAALGARAEAWVRAECSWEHVAGMYHEFLTALRDRRPWPDFDVEPPEAPAPAAPAVAPVTPQYLAGWAADEGARGYIETHKDRLLKTLEMTPAGSSADRILEMGTYFQITAALKTKLGYGEVRGCYYGPAGTTKTKKVISSEGEAFELTVEMFDAEKDPFPYPDEYFSTVLCCELIEHLPSDPMHLMSEVNRILKPGGHFLVTTPNIASLRALAAILQGFHPGFFPAYLTPKTLEEGDARHNREYTPKEIWMLFHYAGFQVDRLETGEFREGPRAQHHWVRHLLEQYKLPTDWRGDGIYALGKKTAKVRERYPAFLYS